MHGGRAAWEWQARGDLEPANLIMLSRDAERQLVRAVWHASLKATWTFRRLNRRVRAATGSGKTETFLFLVLKHARLARTPANGEVGVEWTAKWLTPGDLLREFVVRLTALSRKADPGRFAGVLALRQRGGSLWTAFRPETPPGQLIMASGHATRGPDTPRMPQESVIRGEPLVCT